ncbi:MAG: ATP-binding cassette domain-containing protein [Myxococcota bacterium]
MSERQLRIEGVTLVRKDAARGARTILNEVSATFSGGQVCVVTGATGAGKSSLLHILAGLLRPTAGTVYAGQTPVSRWVAGHRDRWRRTVGIALQAPHLLDDLSVVENVMIPLIPRFTRLGRAEARARAALAEVDAEPLATAAVSGLSGGQRQRIGLARAVVTRPDYLLIDEPTAHQDDAGAQKVAALLTSAKDRGAVVIATAHDPRLVDCGVADQRFHLADGRLAPIDGTHEKVDSP